jgi:hypothetical protein
MIHPNHIDGSSGWLYVNEEGWSPMRGRSVYRVRRRERRHQLIWLIDLHILPLVRALNELEGIRTISSCGGHENPGPSQYEAGSWYVKFEIAWDEAGRSTLEWLAWLINNEGLKMGRDIILYPYAPPPGAARRGQGLSFVLEGHHGEDAAGVAAWITEGARARMRGGRRTADEL